MQYFESVIVCSVAGTLAVPKHRYMEAQTAGTLFLAAIPFLSLFIFEGVGEMKLKIN
jgi:hypothetical protein